MVEEIPRISILVQGTEEYGVGQVALTLATELKRRGGQPAIIAFEHGALTKRCEDEGIDFRLLGLPIWPSYSRNKLKTAWTLFRQRLALGEASRTFAKVLHDLSADALVVQWPFHVELAGKSAQRAAVRCHWMMPNIIGQRWPLGLNRRYYQHLCRRLNITPLPNSRYTGNSLGDGVGSRVLYLGVDEARFHPDPASSFTRAELNLPADACVAGVFARIETTKGHLPLWRAMCELIDEGENLHLLVIGGPVDGPLAELLRAVAAERNAESRLHFAGWTKQPERYYDAIDFAVNSRIDPEPFGLSVVEAMLMGRPVLAHALGGPAETVVDGVTGWHVAAATTEAFAAGLRRVMQDRSRWQEMGAAARQHALANFSSTAFVSNYLQFVQSQRPISQ